MESRIARLHFVAADVEPGEFPRASRPSRVAAFHQVCARLTGGPGSEDAQSVVRWGSGLGGEDHETLSRAVGVAPHVAIKGQVADQPMTVELGAGSTAPATTTSTTRSSTWTPPSKSSPASSARTWAKRPSRSYPADHYPSARGSRRCPARSPGERLPEAAIWTGSWISSAVPRYSDSLSVGGCGDLCPPTAEAGPTAVTSSLTGDPSGGLP
jgi:hypothetical protein